MHIKNHMVFNLRKCNRKPIKQIRQPRPKFLRHIRRPRRRALDASSVEHVDSDAPALGDDFSEEVHRAIESSVLLVSSNTQVIIFRRYIREYMHPPNTRLGSAPLFMKQHHEAAFRSTWSPYVGGASSYATMFQTEAQQVTLEDQQLGLGETRSTQANIQPRDYVSWSFCLCQERPPMCIPSLLLCSLTASCGGCRWRVIFNSTRPTARHSRYSSGRSTAYQGYHGCPLIGCGSCGYITLRRSVFSNLLCCEM
jgi:hypothetical protein